MSAAKKSRIELEVDLHGYTAAHMRSLLEHEWPMWKGMRRVRMIHGRGTVLRPELQRWCAEMGIPCEPEPNNPGSSIIYPTLRQLPDAGFNVYLRDKGLSLTPQEEQGLRDPVAARRTIAVEQARRASVRRQQEADAAAARMKLQQDEAMWQDEISRLDKLPNRKRGAFDAKPSGPVVRPPSQIKHQEGWWNAELVRVADTDNTTLRKQKRTGLEKLAPPVTAEKPLKPTNSALTTRARNTAEDTLLFEAEMKKLEQ